MKRYTMHLLYNTMFGKALLHKLVLRSATLETALARADMPTKGTQTSLQKYFSEEFVIQTIKVYTTVLQDGDEPTFSLLAQMKPPQNFQIWEPDDKMLPLQELQGGGVVKSPDKELTTVNSLHKEVSETRARIPMLTRGQGTRPGTR